MKHLIDAMNEQKEVSALMIALFLVSSINFLITYFKWKKVNPHNTLAVKNVKFAGYAVIGCWFFAGWMLLWILGYVS